MLNKHLFPDGLELTSNEKSPNICFVDTLEGRGAPRDAGERNADLATMTETLRRFYLLQFDRSLLDGGNYDLLVMDSYSDMNFELWRHRTEGWRQWVHPKHLSDPAGFRAAFESEGRCSIDAAVDAACRVIDHVRLANPGLPVMFLTQPAEYYAKLQSRLEFDRLGERVAAKRDGVYFAAPLAASELEPVDLGSCGPGQTLHFSAATYLRMIEDAWRRGLDRHFVQEEEVTSANVSPVRSESANDEGMAESIAAAPAIEIGYGAGSPTCCPACTVAIEAASKSFGRYFSHNEGRSRDNFTPMLIGADQIANFEAWESHIRSFGKGARLRQKRKAIAKGYYVKPFAWRQFIPDIHAANHSKAIRSGGTMRGTYLNTIEEMGGAPVRPIALLPPKCTSHWAMAFGVFEKAEGHKQGAVQVDERLVGYISLRRTGDIALYAQILGHGEHLDNGILALLHHEVVRWAGANMSGLTSGLKYLMYGGAQNGGAGLYRFKRQSGFTPHHVTVRTSESVRPPKVVEENAGHQDGSSQTAPDVLDEAPARFFASWFPKPFWQRTPSVMRRL